MTAAIPGMVTNSQCCQDLAQFAGRYPTGAKKADGHLPALAFDDSGVFSPVLGKQVCYRQATGS